MCQFYVWRITGWLLTYVHRSGHEHLFNSVIHVCVRASVLYHLDTTRKPLIRLRLPARYVSIHLLQPLTKHLFLILYYVLFLMWDDLILYNGLLKMKYQSINNPCDSWPEFVILIQFLVFWCMEPPSSPQASPAFPVVGSIALVDGFAVWQAT